MAAARKVGVFVGSLRKESLTRRVANAIVKVAPPSLAFEFVDFATLPSYNPDLEASPPPEWVAFRRKVSAVEALLFATPEYNRSVPGALKNAIDVGSRPYGKGALNGKPGAVVSVSPGHLSGFGANHHLRQMLVFLNVPTLQQPEAYIGGADKLFDAEGNLTNESTREFLRSFTNAFAAWIELNLAGKE
ncbi:MAG: NAD(P)H-dependent oxidoreductase [Gemmatimonadaceae bacterium]